MTALPAAGPGPIEGPLRPVDAIFDRLLALHPKLIDLSLDRMWRLLDRLGHPEHRLPPVIHVAGTNGKGSTVAFMRAILEAAGKRVHVYTSPHLVRFNERIRLAGTLVDDARLTQALAQAEEANGGEPITFFEITTAAALLLFAQVPADILLLEVGLGGRLDATNVIDKPLVSVITPVSIDHVDFLGETVAEIAGEKAGILKRGVPAVLGHQPREALAAIERQAARLGVPLSVMGEHYQAHEEGGRLVVADEAGLMDLPRPRLVGPHQIVNAGLAVEALRVADLGLPAYAFEEGMRSAQWPARLQRLGPGPLTQRAPEGVDIWLDGGHNAAGGQALAAALADLEDRVSRPLVLVVGMLGNKDADAFLAPFAGLARELVAVPVPGEHKGAAPEALAEAARAHGLDASTAPSVAAALEGLAAFPVGAAPRVLIAGSLYLAGAVLGENGALPD
ncbi:bifunctional folylpolyglutamate synthase/dihydrofolate synthase [Ancylobacter rudongensis]|uniref:Dihydrofolate synthase/folylpolyglutamate synthase n=1 Tax=Ancylobacter rudongensis TaxID=177413 RepID=A0A1G4SP71_9HYPH|nr:folylpolyglutamate synthase/dihydrofolate synthase family protein [Ancylobacter rudongensis]SCW71044.1 dihydrofolate synthase / folylpolyglutamate synthase [Ancylobacter rudongensis]